MSQLKLPDNWESLKVEEVLMGGVKKKIKYDPSTNTVYMLKENGDWTGEKAHPPVREAAAAANKAQEDEGKPQDENGAEATTEAAPIRRKKKRRFGLTAILVIIIIILSGVLIFQSLDSGSPTKYYDVIIAMENIQPGEEIYGKLAKRTISQEEYLQYAAVGGIYTMNDYDAIKRYFATTFIPEGGVIAYDNVGMEFNAENPWTMEGKANIIRIPIDLEVDSLSELMWGNKIKITVTATRPISTEERPDASRPSSPEINGSTVDVTYRTDTYVLENVTIVDVLNKSRESLYGTYAALAAIPEIYQNDCITNRYASGSQLEEDAPFYICIPVSSKTSSWWTSINNERRNVIQVSIEVTGADCNTDYKVQTHQAMKAMVLKLQKAFRDEA